MVIETKGSNNGWGFGGIDVILQGTPDWYWAKSAIISGWLDYSVGDGSDTVYIVVELEDLDTYDSITADLQLFIAYGSDITGLGIQEVYLVEGDITKPGDAVDLVNGFAGYITKTNVLE